MLQSDKDIELISASRLGLHSFFTRCATRGNYHLPRDTLTIRLAVASTEIPRVSFSVDPLDSVCPSTVNGDSSVRCQSLTS